MRRTWPIPTAIAILGALAGSFIAGRPAAIETLVIDAVVETSSPSPTSVAPTTLETSTTIAVGTTSPTTTTVTSSTTVASTTSTAATTTTAETTTTVPADETLPPAEVRLVLANGVGSFDLAGRNGMRLEAVGYVQIDLEDAAKVPATVLYYRPGFADEAAVVAGFLNVPNAPLEPLPDTPITSNDALGDVIVVLGPDVQR